MIKFHCEYCGRPLGAKDSALGKAFKCPGCGRMVVARDEGPEEESDGPLPQLNELPPAVGLPRQAPAPGALPQPRQAPVPGALPQPRQAPVPGALPQPRSFPQPRQFPQPVAPPPPVLPDKAHITAADYTDTDDRLRDALAAAQSGAPSDATGAAPPVRPKARVKRKQSSAGWIVAFIGLVCVAAGVGAYFYLHPPGAAPETADQSQAPSQTPPPSTQAAAEGDLRGQELGELKISTTWPPPPTPPRPPPAGAAISQAELFAQASPSVGRVDHLDKDGKRVAVGTGFFVSADALMITTYHVIDGGGDAKVVMPDGREYDIAGVAAVNRAEDLALLKVKTAGVAFLNVWDGDPPRVGAPVFAIGNAEGAANSVSKGLISGLRDNGYGEVTAIQTTAPISQNATGGPLLTKSGLVIGVTTTPASDGQNINLAAPSREIVRLIARRADLRSIADLATEQGEAQEAQTIDQAISQIYAGDPVQALLTLQSIPEEHRQNWRYWFASGFAHETQKKPDLADADFDKAVQLKPDSANAWLIMGTAFLQRSHPELAAPCFSKALELDPATLPAYAGLARSQHRNGQPTEAIVTCKRGLDIIPGNAELLLVLGSCQAATGNRAEARAAFKQVIDPATHASDTEQQFAQESLRELGYKP